MRSPNVYNVYGEISNVAHSNAINNDVSQVMLRLGISEAYLSRLLKAADIDYRGEPLPEQANETPPLSTKEIEVLRSGGARGLDRGPASHAARVNSLQRLVKECQTLTEQALDSGSVAQILHTSVAEVENSARCTPPYLHGFEPVPGEWRFPRWQFTDVGPIPHLATLLSIVASKTPLPLDRFMRLPNCDLEVDAKCLCPRDWLVAQHDPEPVFQLARFLNSD